MAMTYITGRAGTLRAQLLAELRGALATGENPLMVIVPQQLTLETEMTLLTGLNLAGSFRLQVVSPDRLIQLLFDETGHPGETRVDDRGRVMLMHEAVRHLKKALTVYRDAQKHRNFADQAVRQITLFKQAGIETEEIAALAEKQPEGMLRQKLRDLAAIYEAYEAALAGRYQDGEDETNAAVARIEKSRVIREAQIWVYGFDLMPPIMHRLLVTLAQACRALTLFLPLETDEAARDFEVFHPLADSLARLTALAAANGLGVSRLRVEQAPPEQAELRHLANEIYAAPVREYTEPVHAIQLVSLKNPLEEAMFAAALARQLVMQRGYRYADIRVLTQNIQGYADVIAHAFSMYDVPVFLSEGRPADRHPLAQALIQSLRLISGGFTAEDVRALLATGYTAVNDEDAERFMNYMNKYGLRGNAFFRPLRRGEEETIAQLEPVRRAFAEPLETLRGRLKDAACVEDQLTALFSYLLDIHADETGQLAREALIAAGERILAADDAQVWNRLIGTLDQMHALLGEKKLPLADLVGILEKTLEVSEIKTLPQSADAVSAESIGRISTQPVKALILIGMTDQSVQENSGLFIESEQRYLTDSAGLWLGPDASERTRIARLYIKSALDLATDYVCVTYPLSAADDAALRPGNAVGLIRAMFPGLHERGGVTGDRRLMSMRYNAKESALALLAVELGQRAGMTEVAGKVMTCLADQPDTRTRLQLLRDALTRTVASEALSPLTARRIYGAMRNVSITRLERYAACPFSHFVRYGLAPEVIEPYQMDARSNGTFIHDAVRMFLERIGAQADAMEIGESIRRMDEVTQALQAEAQYEIIEDTNVNRANALRLRRAARVTAQVLAAQLKGSRFLPVALEMPFGAEGQDAVALQAEGGDCFLGGRIDRVDEWSGESGNLLRVIDYKFRRSAKPLVLSDVYAGLQLQLPIYLAVAAKKFHGRPAGMFYFRTDDLILLSNDTDPDLIRNRVQKELRMSGLLPDDIGIVRAMAPDPARVFPVQIRSTTGEMYDNTQAASEGDFRRLIAHAIRRASDFVTEIRAGKTDISPVRQKQSDACAYCEYRTICLVDSGIGGAVVRRPETLSAREVLQKLENDD